MRPKLAATVTHTLLCSPLLISALNITIYQPNVPFVPSPLPPSHAQSDGNEIIALFQNLGRTTVWKSIANVLFEGNTYEPEGMVRLGADRYIVSAGEYTQPTVSYNATINGTDRSAGAGFAHLMYSVATVHGLLMPLTPQGAIEYHNGGIDYDGEYIWATIAQYRPRTLEPETILEDDDHLGGIVYDAQTNRISALNWGSRNESTWDLNPLECTVNASSSRFTRPNKIVHNPSYFVDYQDCKFLGHAVQYDDRPVMLCSGVATIGGGVTAFNLGGIAIVDVETMLPLAEVPITMTSALGVPVTENPVNVSVENGRLRLYWLPDQHNSTLYIYEAQPDSPYEF